jgi:hypothetical protein
VHVHDRSGSVRAGRPRPASPGRGHLWPPAKPQHYTKRLVLLTDHAKHAAIPIAIVADVGLPLVAEPVSLDFGTVPVGGKRELSVTIRNRSAEPIRLLYSTFADGPCSAKVPSKAIPPGAGESVPVVVSADKPGRQERTLLIHTDCLSHPVLRVPVVVTGGK